MQTITKKIPGGKLIRIKATCKDGIITDAQISGDFFLFPAEQITTLEEALVGLPSNATQEIEEVLAYVIAREHISIQGFTPKDIATALGELQ